ncbi:MAG TPA: ATP-binding protein [Streptosporangiaceae bacterium]|jgi:signal transduction histidine kinase|nr:ATP-binding protein [Streptosporangiaceae bacterium]
MAQYGPPELAVMARGTQAAGPAMTALRAVGASTASIIRCLGIAYTLGQLAIWHSFFAANPWRLVGPVIAMAWGAAVVVYLSRRRPGWAPAAVDSGVYIGLALGAGWCVPAAMRGDGSNWLYIVMLGQLVAPAWFSPIVVSAPLALATVAAYYVGAVMAPHVSSGDGAPLAATVMLLAIAAAAWAGRRLLVRRASGADIALEQVDVESRAHYVDLTRHTERREHERMLHDTVLNTLTALARADPADVGAGAAGPAAGAVAAGAAGVVAQCRRDVALMERALAGPNDAGVALAGLDGGRPGGRGLAAGIAAVAAELRDRGLRVNVEMSGGPGPAVPPPVATALTHAAREALVNVLRHAGTGEAWVTVRPAGRDEATAEGAVVTVRDAGAGFDTGRVDALRLGLRRSIAERVDDCGGQATIRSAPGEGTLVTLRWDGPAPW